MFAVRIPNQPTGIQQLMAYPVDRRLWQVEAVVDRRWRKGNSGIQQRFDDGQSANTRGEFVLLKR